MAKKEVASRRADPTGSGGDNTLGWDGCHSPYDTTKVEFCHANDKALPLSPSVWAKLEILGARTGLKPVEVAESLILTADTQLVCVAHRLIPTVVRPHRQVLPVNFFVVDGDE